MYVCMYIHSYTPPCHTRPLAETHSMDMFMRATPLYPPIPHSPSACRQCCPLVQWVVYSCASNIACNADPSLTPPLSPVCGYIAVFGVKKKEAFGCHRLHPHPPWNTHKSHSKRGQLSAGCCGHLHARTCACMSLCVCACVCICNACIFIENLYLNWNEFQIYNAVIVACFKVDAIPRNQKNTKATTTIRQTL